MHPSFQKFSPFREPKWRHDRVLNLVDAQPRPAPVSRKLDDAWVSKYRAFLLEWRQREDNAEKMALYTKAPGVFYAHLLNFHPDREWKVLVESYILAGMSDEEIADEIATLPEAIEAFEALFFNVRDRLKAETWIVKQIMGAFDTRRAGRDGQISVSQWDMLLKLFGYYGGPNALKLLLSGFPRGTKPDSQREVTDWFDKALTANVHRNSVMAARCIEINKYNATQLMELHLRLMELAMAAKQGNLSATAIDKNIDAVLKEMAWSVGKSKVKKLPEKIRKYQTTAAELRADEALALVSGSSLSNEQTDALEQLRISVTEQGE